jgi:hypothetical protein
MKMPAIILDIDGCLSNSEMCKEHQHLIDKGDFSWFDDRILLFRPAKGMGSYVFGLLEAGMDIIIITARQSIYKKKTEWWLKYHFGLNIDNKKTFMFMRLPGDYSATKDLKREFYKRDIKDRWDILFAVDDQDGIISMWNELGINTHQIKINEKGPKFLEFNNAPEVDKDIYGGRVFSIPCTEESKLIEYDDIIGINGDAIKVLEIEDDGVNVLITGIEVNIEN